MFGSELIASGDLNQLLDFPSRRVHGFRGVRTDKETLAAIASRQLRQPPTPGSTDSSRSCQSALTFIWRVGRVIRLSSEKGEDCGYTTIAGETEG